MLFQGPPFPNMEIAEEPKTFMVSAYYVHDALDVVQCQDLLDATTTGLLRRLGIVIDSRSCPTISFFNSPLNVCKDRSR